MAQQIRFNFTEMTKTAGDIRTIAESYRTAGSRLIQDFESAVSAWEGDSKEKLLTLFQTAINDYLTTSIPQALEALAKLLDENAKSMQDADNQIASQIPSSL